MYVARTLYEVGQRAYSTQVQVVAIVNPTSCEAEFVLPEYLSAASHSREVLDLRPSLGLPRMRSEEMLTPSTGYTTGSRLFITNGDAEQSFSTAVTSMHSQSSIGSFLTCSSTASEDLDTTIRPLRLNDFQQIRGIGAGGFGQVFLVKHRQTGLQVALKVIDKRFCDHKAVKSEQHALIRVAAARAPGIMEFLGSFHNSRHYFLVTVCHLNPRSWPTTET